jgi:hypothetical protein
MKYDDTVHSMIQYLQKQITPLKEFEQLYTSTLRDTLQLSTERERLLHSLVPDIENRYRSLAELAKSEVERYNEMVLSKNHMAEIVNATSIVSNLFKDRESLTRMTREAINTSKYWQTQLDVYKSFSVEAEACRLALIGHYSDVTGLSLIVQEHIQRLDWNTIGFAIGMSRQMVSTTASSFSKLLENYGHLFQSFEEAKYNIASFPPFVSKLPPVEIITASDFLATISHSKQTLSPQQVAESQTQITQEIELSLEDLLSKLNPKLISLWQGAKAALKSHNPDRSRHIVVSLRELITHVLHQTAPDNDIQSWTDDQSFFDKGRPTRKARLHFICRGLNHEPFEQFINRDVSAHLELIQILQRGTHNVSIGLTDEQLSALVVKTESLIRFILVIWNSNN